MFKSILTLLIFHQSSRKHNVCGELKFSIEYISTQKSTKKYVNYIKK